MKTSLAPDLESLRRDGFVRARGLLPVADVSAALDSIHRTILDQLRVVGAPTAGLDLHAGLRALHAADIERYKKVLGALWRKGDVSGLMRHPALFAYLRETFGWRDVFLPGGDVALLMAADLKIPGGYFGLGAHQDFPSVQGSLNGVVAWIPLTPVDRDGWPVEVVPGSHRRGLITNVDETRNGWEIRPEALEGADWLPIEADVGDVVFLSVFTAHRSRQEGDPMRLRLALSTRFDDASEPTFVERAYPTAYQRSVHRDQYVADFPSADQIRALFG